MSEANPICNHLLFLTTIINKSLCCVPLLNEDFWCLAHPFLSHPSSCCSLGGNPLTCLPQRQCSHPSSMSDTTAKATGWCLSAFWTMLQNFKHTLLWHQLLVFPACLRLTPQSYYITMLSCQWASLLSLQLYCFFYVKSYSPVLFSLLALVFLAHQKVLIPKLSCLTSYRRR